MCFRSLDGEGNFNWRFIFPLEYLPAEQAMVLRQKEHFWSLDKTEKHVPPKLMIQIWDNDKFSADDFLGTLELDLNRMPKPTKRSGSCSLDQLISAPTMSLFEAKRAYGYWPCYDTTPDGKRELTGKVEMEVEIVTEEEADLKPAGKGQDEPNMNPHLDPPNRPETSFLWFASPWKTLRYIVWRNYKWYIIGGLLLILLLVLVILFIYSIPGVSVEKIFGVNA
ncbi:myoferlin-like [Lingula anatina]|uniref:Myoferlin-like n=1 Tax=Lingula anatina TaxID=7574 RepID=A0A1S3HPG9_LINAN|nr:myoferlin-like [Lingula anatina]|eukprot:XP_013387948.1 myoferlin-like [Lingula anatina]